MLILPYLNKLLLCILHKYGFERKNDIFLKTKATALSSIPSDTKLGNALSKGTAIFTQKKDDHT